MTDVYEELGVSPDATRDELKTAFRLFSSKHHPDRGGDTHYFANVKVAYEAAYAAAPTTALCDECKDTGKVTVGSGFSPITMPCPSCGGLKQD